MKFTQGILWRAFPLAAIALSGVLPQLCPAPGATAEEKGSAARSRISPGEKLHYKGYIFGFLPVGDVWMEVAEDTWEGREVYRISARGYGSSPFYTVDIRLMSIVDKATGLSRAYRDRWEGTEKKERELIFDREGGIATYRRRSGRFKTVEEMDAAPWITRNKTPVPPETNDVLNALYYARSIGDEVGDKGSFWFIEKDRPWRVDVVVAGEKRLRIRGLGRFDVLRIDIRPDYSSRADKAAKFGGLFGVGGTLRIYVDKETKIPLLVTGRVPVAYIFHPTVTAVLKELHLPGADR